MKKKLFFSLICASLLFNGMVVKQVKAVSAYPEPVEINQPDGTTLTVQLRGDEHVKWAETNDGYSLVYNAKGVFEYAMSDGDGGMTPSGIAASDDRTPQVSAMLAATPKKLAYSQSQVSMLKSIHNLKAAEAQQAFPTQGNRKLICILMGFKDKPFTKSKADFNNLFNQVNYSTGGATGSVKDFYLESSYGQLNLDVSVAGPYTASKNMSYYGGNSSQGGDSRPRDLVKEAVNAADSDVNFADFDNDNNGSVDGVYLIYAGYGEEAGGGSNAIWAHAWSIPTVYKDGKKVNRYSCSAELKGNSGSKITAIGVICHEFGHVLGAPDYYDTDYSTGGSFSGTGRWDMMAGGSWNNGGITPAQHNAFTKVVIYGWANATVLSSAKNVSVKNSVENKSFYRINSKTNNEYWIMENRQKKGFDAKIPGHGLMIYHVHKNVHNVGNKINATSPQKMYPVCASASTNPGSSKSSYGSINSGGCPFPGTSNKTSLTDATTPHMKSWAGQNTNAPITEIKETNGVITFKFKGGGSGDTQAPTKPSNLKSLDVTSSSLSLSWNASSDNVGVKSYSVYQNNKKVKSVSGTSTSITGLTASTSYSFYVKAADAAGNISGASNTVNVTTKPLQPTYCASKGSNSSYEWISKVVIGDLTNSSNAAGYTDFTGKTITTQAGKVINVALKPGFSNQTYNEYWKIWIDYNNDKDFDDAGELAFDAGAMSKSEVTGFITIPANAEGTTRLRVSMKYNASQTVCETFKYGEVEDYTIVIEKPDTIPPSRPYGLSLKNITKTSAEITWKPSTDNVKVAGYKLYVNGSFHGETTKLSYNFNDLTPGTEYSLKVAAFDEAGNRSGKSNKLVAKTLDEVLNYCSSKGNNVYYEWIDYVEMAGIKNTTAANNGYADFTEKVAIVAPGASVKIYMSAGFRSSSYTEFWSVWIDWNKNGAFDADELMVHGSSSSSDLFSGTVKVPSTATGSTRMRVTMKYRAAATPCETFTYGEVEDYTVVISNGASVPDMSLASVSTLGNEDRVYDVTIKPNPASGNTLFLECADTRATQYSIFNIYGAKVLDGQLNAQRNEIDIMNLVQGVYILKVNDGQKEITEKFVRE